MAADPIKPYLVTLRTECVLPVIVHAFTKKDAREQAEQGAYRPIGRWEPLRLSDARVSRVIEMAGEEEVE